MDYILKIVTNMILFLNVGNVQYSYLKKTFFLTSVYFLIILYDILDNRVTYCNSQIFNETKKDLSVRSIGKYFEFWGVIMVMSWSLLINVGLAKTKNSFLSGIQKRPVTLDSWWAICYLTISLFFRNPLLQWKHWGNVAF